MVKKKKKDFPSKNIFEPGQCIRANGTQNRFKMFAFSQTTMTRQKSVSKNQANILPENTFEKLYRKKK